jgi:hypothetical protein
MWRKNKKMVEDLIKLGKPVTIVDPKSGAFLIGNSEPGIVYTMKIEIVERYKTGETFTIIDVDGDLEYMSKHMGFNYKVKKLPNDKTEITYNPI